MMSGDGLVVRVRPRVARLDRAQTLGLCAASLRHGNGTIDLTNRANLQLRGVAPDAHHPLLLDLAALDLLDAEPGIETRRNILITPFYCPDDLTARLTLALIDRLADLPDLPAKFGYAIDTGPARLLAGASADIRLERGDDNTLILRADGADTGRVVSESTAIDALIDLARWFSANATPEARRMAKALETATLPDIWTGTLPIASDDLPQPGPSPHGTLYGVPFGQISAQALTDLIRKSGACALRVTPWRLILLEGAEAVRAPDFVTAPNDPVLAANACTGAPLCPQAQVETRRIARQLAPLVNGTLHVSGCAKGCAHQGSALVTLVGRNGRFDLVKQGGVRDEPAKRDLTPETLLTMTDLT
jgi:precorrin-3B synthase